MKKKLPLIAITLMFLCFVIACGFLIFREEQAKEKLADAAKADPDKLEATFLSVGNADSTLVSCGGSYMLIDGGDRSDAKYISRAIKRCGAKKLDYVICTHPHDDHMGSLPAVVEEFEVGRIFCANVPYGEKLSDELKYQAQSKGVAIEHPERGETLNLGSAYVVFLSSGKQFAEENDMSLIIKLFHGEKVFLFMADAGFEAENELISSGISVSCDLLKAAHHGSAHSSGEKFLSESLPEYVIISSAKNDFEHPADETLERLAACGAEVLRTDELGDITAVSDGKTLRFEFQKQ